MIGILIQYAKKVVKVAPYEIAKNTIVVF
jgi:hypothetical protein